MRPSSAKKRNDMQIARWSILRYIQLFDPYVLATQITSLISVLTPLFDIYILFGIWTKFMTIHIYIPVWILFWLIKWKRSSKSEHLLYSSTYWRFIHEFINTLFGLIWKSSVWKLKSSIYSTQRESPKP